MLVVLSGKIMKPQVGARKNKMIIIKMEIFNIKDIEKPFKIIIKSSRNIFDKQE